MDRSPTSKLSNSILNGRVIKQHELNHIKHFQQLASTDLNDLKLVENRTTLQKIYYNSIQGYYEKIIKDLSQHNTFRVDSIRG